MRINYIVGVLIMAIYLSCDREATFELGSPSLLTNLEGAIEIVQEPGTEVFIEFTLQAASGLSELRIFKDGQSFNSINFIDEISSTYQFFYSIPEDATNGSQSIFNFVLLDNRGNETAFNYTVKVNTTFSEQQEVINGILVTKLKGRLNTNFQLQAANTYVIDSTFSIENNSTLTIEKGSTVYFKTFPENNLTSKLVITRGAKMIAEGTAEEPIVFTSDKILLNQQPSADDWGGIYIYGSAPVNQGTQILEEGFRYGGTISNENSGTLKYVRIEYAGKNGAHGIHLFGTGSGTLVEYVQIFQNENIAFRIKGGRVNLKYIAAIGHGGYGIWAEHGWQGNGQFWIFQTNRQATLVPQNFWNQGRSIEMRNDENFFLTAPRTTFRISNITLIGNGFESAVNNGTRRGIRIRRGANGILQNAIVTGFPDEGVRIEDLDVSELGNSMVLSNTRSFANQTNYAQEAESFFEFDPQFNVNQSPISGITLENFVGSEASDFNPIQLGSWFTSAAYIGAIESISNDWTTNGNWFKNLDGSIR